MPTSFEAFAYHQSFEVPNSAGEPYLLVMYRSGIIAWFYDEEGLAYFTGHPRNELGLEE